MCPDNNLQIKWPLIGAELSAGSSLSSKVKGTGQSSRSREEKQAHQLRQWPTVAEKQTGIENCK